MIVNLLKYSMDECAKNKIIIRILCSSQHQIDAQASKYIFYDRSFRFFNSGKVKSTSVAVRDIPEAKHFTNCVPTSNMEDLIGHVQWVLCYQVIIQNEIQSNQIITSTIMAQFNTKNKTLLFPLSNELFLFSLLRRWRG